MKMQFFYVLSLFSVKNIMALGIFHDYQPHKINKYERHHLKRC